jgi:xyloglucan-specific endo-beta-1,4-glucanase
MKFTQAFLPLVLSGAALASPTPVLEERAATTICGQWDSVATGSYTVYQNLWNEAKASSGQSKMNLLIGNN